ncbi:hypothetical protein M407DRAFT_28692 [Tulasnella calospora MUT 4182]|uniref:Uncharacterized protein n=1 Tax=Tulasnella calospora MUT 4182 TaxID=1051891 RepID=A0A0C3QBK9_9AGAM|nr:hypothetical protein M407DRAFT_28692 [Tulasnella calospora MUT 4182]
MPGSKRRANLGEYARKRLKPTTEPVTTMSEHAEFSASPPPSRTSSPGPDSDKESEEEIEDVEIETLEELNLLGQQLQTHFMRTLQEAMKWQEQEQLARTRPMRYNKINSTNRTTLNPRQSKIKKQMADLDDNELETEIETEIEIEILTASAEVEENAILTGVAGSPSLEISDDFEDSMEAEAAAGWEKLPWCAVLGAEEVTTEAGDLEMLNETGASDAERGPGVYPTSVTIRGLRTEQGVRWTVDCGDKSEIPRRSWSH